MLLTDEQFRFGKFQLKGKAAQATIQSLKQNSPYIEKSPSKLWNGNAIAF